MPEAWRRISVSEAVPLGYAMVLYEARRIGVRALGIKGPTAVVQGLRSASGSIDVDILCDPDAESFSSLWHVLEGNGWTTTGFSESPFLYEEHSITFTHPLWPIEIDLHRQFPGLLAEPILAFNELWSRHTEVSIAGVDVPVPATVDHAIILCLHIIRDSRRQDVHHRLGSVLARLVPMIESPRLLAERAVSVGAAEAMAPVFEMLGTQTPSDERATAERTQQWNRRTHARTTAVTPWIYEITSSRSRFRTLMRALFPSTTEIARHDPRAASSPLRRALFVVRRLIRGARQLPNAIRDIRDAERRP